MNHVIPLLNTMDNSALCQFIWEIQVESLVFGIPYEATPGLAVRSRSDPRLLVLANKSNRLLCNAVEEANAGVNVGGLGAHTEGLHLPGVHVPHVPQVALRHADAGVPEPIPQPDQASAGVSLRECMPEIVPGVHRRMLPLSQQLRTEPGEPRL